MTTSRFVEIAGYRIEYVEHPAHQVNRPPLVFLHEGLGSVAMWRDFPQKVAAVTGCRTIVYSRIGFGRSSLRRAPCTPRFMHEEALEILPQLRRALGIERPVLVGHSTGASMALIHAAMPESEPTAEIATDEPPMADLPIAEEPAPAEAEPVAEDKPKTRKRPRARKKVEAVSETETAPAAEAVDVAPAVKEAVDAELSVADASEAASDREASAKRAPKRKPRAKKKADDAPVEAKPASKAAVTPEPSNEDAPTEPRRGWWQRMLEWIFYRLRRWF